MSGDENLNRFEVIDHRGSIDNHHRAVVVGPTADVRIRVLEQDDGRTLKVVLSDRDPSQPELAQPTWAVEATTEAVGHFRDAVATFLSWVDEGGSPEALIPILSSLLHFGFGLPQVEATDADTNDLRAQVEYGHVRRTVAERLRHDAYWVPLDPFKLDVEEVETTLGMISDDIVDIYIDLSHGALVEDRYSLTDAIWEWRFSFETHWGRHASEAFSALYRLYR